MKIRIYQSGKGDCLRITGASGGNILVDGGVGEAFDAHVRSDLGALAASNVPLDLVYISHIDDDHIAGVLRLLDLTMQWRVYDYQVSKGKNPKVPIGPRMPKVHEIWHNAFSMLYEENAQAVEDLLAQSSSLLSLSTDADVLGIASEQHELAYSIEQAIRVSRRIATDQLAIPLNSQFDGSLILVRTPPGTEAQVGKMKLTVIGPFAADVEILKHEWNTWLEEHSKRLAELKTKVASDAAAIGNTAGGVPAVLDISLKQLGNRKMVTPPNLASLMLLLEEKGKRVLLTGDGHADDILAGLEFQGKLDGKNKIHVDVLKVQHHGSEHNIHEQFVRQVSADNYVFCGNGMHENPDLDGLTMLLDTNKDERPNQKYKLWFNCSSVQAPTGSPREHMKAVEKLVAKYVSASGGKISAEFLSASNFDLSL